MMMGVIVLHVIKQNIVCCMRERDQIKMDGYLIVVCITLVTSCTVSGMVNHFVLFYSLWVEKRVHVE